MKTLSEMQKMSRSNLVSFAAECTNRQLSIAATQMVAAMDAHAMGDMKAMMAHVERAKIAHKRAQEDERGQVARVQATQAVVAERGAALKVNSKVCATAKALTVGFVPNWIGDVR